MPDFSFGKPRRLLKARDFQAVFDDPRFKVGHQYLLMLVRPNELGYPRLGLVIAKKNVRLAVQRNRIKRVLRENFRLSQVQLGGLDIVVLARRGIDNQTDSELHILIKQSLSRLIRKAGNVPTALPAHSSGG